jgi:hypothetical protein
MERWARAHRSITPFACPTTTAGCISHGYGNADCPAGGIIGSHRPSGPPPPSRLAPPVPPPCCCRVAAHAERSKRRRRWGRRTRPRRCLSSSAPARLQDGVTSLVLSGAGRSGAGPADRRRRTGRCGRRRRSWRGRSGGRRRRRRSGAGRRRAGPPPGAPPRTARRRRPRRRSSRRRRGGRPRRRCSRRGRRRRSPCRGSQVSVAQQSASPLQVPRGGCGRDPGRAGRCRRGRRPRRGRSRRRCRRSSRWRWCTPRGRRRAGAAAVRREPSRPPRAPASRRPGPRRREARRETRRARSSKRRSSIRGAFSRRPDRVVPGRGRVHDPGKDARWMDWGGRWRTSSKPGGAGGEPSLEETARSRPFPRPGSQGREGSRGRLGTAHPLPRSTPRQPVRIAALPAALPEPRADLGRFRAIPAA